MFWRNVLTDGFVVCGLNLKTELLATGHRQKAVFQTRMPEQISGKATCEQTICVLFFLFFFVLFRLPYLRGQFGKLSLAAFDFDPKSGAWLGLSCL